jgi:hypothetical protein
MTAGMTTQKLDGTRVSLPRTGLGALLAATLLAGTLIGAGVYAGVGAAMAKPEVVSVTLPRESAVVRHQRITVGRGQLIGDGESTTDKVAPTAPNLPKALDSFDHGR